ncbi:MAG: AAC(3) family N-acetyltransferase [Clostridia bacterium]|nr:AAC(3) family N-acetyltransferase [Clostridia bacterium]
MKEKIQQDLLALGIQPGDVVLMHSSYKSLGQIEGGAKTFFEAFLELLGDEGTLVLPTLSFKWVTKEAPLFDKNETPSCVGYLSEFFRTNVPGVMRSMHATHSCAAVGKYAEFLTKDHEKDATPVGENSPFRKLPQVGGKILMLGCGKRCNTSMHGVEELTIPPYLFDKENPITYTLKDGDKSITIDSMRHYFLDKNGNHLGQRYDRVADLLSETEISHGFVLEAECYLMDAKAVWQKGNEKLKENPVYFVETLN